MKKESREGRLGVLGKEVIILNMVVMVAFIEKVQLSKNLKEVKGKPWSYLREMFRAE